METQAKSKKRVPHYYEDIKTIAKLDKMSVEDRIRYHTLRVQRTEKVYEKLDRIMMVTLPMSQIKDQLAEVLSRKKMIEGCIALRTSEKFTSHLALQQDLRRRILVSASARLDLFNQTPLPVEAIKKALSTEDMMLDVLIQTELSIEQMCDEVGVSASQFFIAGHLLKTTRGITTIKFCQTHMGYAT